MPDSAKSDPEWALAQRRALDDKVRLFVGYLSDRGVEFDSSDPTTTASPQSEAAIPAAIVDVRALAAHSLVNDLAAEFGDESVPTPAEVRLQVITGLWLNRRWHEPWVSLVNLEFPGAEPTGNEVMAIEAARLVLGGGGSDTAEVNRLVRKLELKLGDPTLNDDLAVTSLAMLIYFGRMTSHFVGVAASHETLLTRRMAANDIVARSSQPTHAAWPAVIDHYFPIPD